MIDNDNDNDKYIYKVNIRKKYPQMRCQLTVLKKSSLSLFIRNVWRDVSRVTSYLSEAQVTDCSARQDLWWGKPRFVLVREMESRRDSADHLYMLEVPEPTRNCKHRQVR